MTNREIAKSSRFRHQGSALLCYTDVYAKWNPFFGKDYVAVSETKKREFIPPKGYKQVQTADDAIYEKICCEVNKQMKKAFAWWRKRA